MFVSRRISVAALCLAMSFTLATGCKRAPKVDPLKAATSAYKQAVEPPIQKSEEIAQAFVQIVLDDKGNPSPDNAAGRIEKEIIPRAKEYLDTISAVHPKDRTLAELHEVLVRAATLRLEGYQLIVKGYRDKNMDVFAQGQKKIQDGQILEDSFVERAGPLLRQQGYELVYFNAPPPSSTH